MIQKTAIIGMGALGLLYADQIAEAKGKDAVCFVMDEERLHKYQGTVFDCNGERRTFAMRSGTEAEPADLVILAVKYNGLESALDTMKNCVGEDTVILSVMNGIRSERDLADRYGWKHVVDTVAQGMDAMKFGSRLRYAKKGERCIGAERPEQEESLRKADEFLTSAGIAHRVEENILHRLWGKFMLNVGVNQTCMAYETNFGGALESGSEANRVMISAMLEVMDLANAEGVLLTEADLDEYIQLIGTLPSDSMPSMRQDGMARRPSEVELFAGTVIAMAEKHHLAVPANRFLYQKIKKMEAEY